MKSASVRPAGRYNTIVSPSWRALIVRRRRALRMIRTSFNSDGVGEFVIAARIQRARHPPSEPAIEGVTAEQVVDNPVVDAGGSS